jgi:hypothetical protein
MDFVELIAILFAWSPKQFFRATVSAMSPSGVEVPWAFT